MKVTKQIYDQAGVLREAYETGAEIQERFGIDEWHEPIGDEITLALDKGCEYRIKPEPLECWVNVYQNRDISNCGSGFRTKEAAEKASAGNAVRVAVHMREVTDD